MPSNTNPKPKIVYFGSIPYQIAYENLSSGQSQEDQGVQDADDNWGCADHSLQKITIDSTSGPHVQRETLMHELLHCVIMWSGLAHKLSRIDPDLEEDIIQCMSPFIFNLFTDPKNASVVKYLFTQE